MRVLMVSPEDPAEGKIRGGLGTHLRKFLEHFPKDSDIELDLLSKDICSWTPLVGLSSYYQDSVRRMTMETIKKGPWDVIHCHDGATFPIGMDIRSLDGTPVVFSGHLFQHQVEIVEGTREGDSFLSYCINQEIIGVNYADEVIVYSEQMKKYAEEVFRAERNIHIIPNGVDVSDFDVAPKKIQTDKPIVCFCGRFSRQKGIEVIFDAIRKTDKYHWLLLGSVASNTPEEGELHPYTQTVKQLCALLPDRVTWPGFVDGFGKASYIKAASVGVMPSLCEPFGISALEFMAAGVPLVSTGVGGLGEFATKKNSIYCIPSVGGLLEGIEYALNQKEALSKLGSETVKRFTWEATVSKTVEVYRKAATDGRKEKTNRKASSWSV